MPDSNVRWLVNQHTPLPKFYNNILWLFVLALPYKSAIVIPDLKERPKFNGYEKNLSIFFVANKFRRYSRYGNRGKSS